MKFFRVSALLVALVALLGAVPVYATEPISDADPSASEPVAEESFAPSESTVTETVVTEDDKNITINVTVPTAPTIEADTSETVADAETESEAESVPSLLELEPTYPTYSMISLDDSGSPAADSSSVSGVMQSLFGTYTPRTQTVTEYLADGSSVTYQEYVPGLAGLDWHWISGVAVFSICLWSLFCLIGGVLKRG